jgi:transposase
MSHTVVGVDLAKEVIQVCVVKHKKGLSNKEMTPNDFTLWLATHPASTVVFEACATSNYWKQKALEYGHDAKLISAK